MWDCCRRHCVVVTPLLLALLFKIMVTSFKTVDGLSSSALRRNWMQPLVTAVSMVMCYDTNQSRRHVVRCCEAQFSFRPLSITLKCVSLISNFLQLVQFWAMKTSGDEDEWGRLCRTRDVIKLARLLQIDTVQAVDQFRNIRMQGGHVGYCQI